MKPTIPKRGEIYLLKKRKYDLGAVYVLGVIDNYVVVRHKGCAPFLITLKDFDKSYDRVFKNEK